MIDRRGIYGVAAIASLLSAVTTAVLIYGPGIEVGPDLDAQAELYDNWLYLYKPWVLFFHPQLAFIASLGVAFALFAKRPVLVAIGLFYLLVWAVTEMTQQAYIIDALNQYWRPGFLAANDGPTETMYTTLITGFRAVSDSQYFVLLFGFGTGTVLFGVAFFAADIYGKVIGGILISLGALSLVAFAGYYTGLSAVTPVTNWLYEYLYGVVQTGVRVAIAAWLWRLGSVPIEPFEDKGGHTP